MTDLEQVCAHLEAIADRLFSIENALLVGIEVTRQEVEAQKTIATLLHMHGCGKTKRDFEEYGR